MVERLASMLDYFLVQLAGPKCIDLKVRNSSIFLLLQLLLILFCCSFIPKLIL